MKDTAVNLNGEIAALFPLATKPTVENIHSTGTGTLLALKLKYRLATAARQGNRWIWASLFWEYMGVGGGLATD